jgi:hypothetical protein
VDVKTKDMVERLGRIIQQSINKEGGKPEDLIVVMPPVLYHKIRMVYNIPWKVELRILGVRCFAGNNSGDLSRQNQKITLAQVREEIEHD